MFRPKSPYVPSGTTANALATTGASVNVSNAVPPVVGKILKATSATAAEWGYALPEGWVSVTDPAYGAVGDGVTLDDTAFQIAAATGAHVYIPPGTLAAPKKYLLSSSITPLSGQIFKMPQSLFGVVDQTQILFVGTTNFCFDLIDRGSRCEGVYVQQHSSYTPTAGGHFRIGSLTQDTYDCSLYRCISRNGFDSFHLRAPSATYYNLFTQITECESLSPIQAGFHINLPSPNGALVMTDNWVRTNAGMNCVGMWVRACDTSQINNFRCAVSKYPIWLNGDLAGVHQMNFIGGALEDADGTGNVIRIGDGTYACNDNTFTSLEAYRATMANLYLGTNANRTVFNAPKLRGFRYVDYGTKNQLLGGTTHNNGTLATGIGVDLHGTDSIVSHHAVQDFATGLNLAAGANYAAINGNNFRGNTAATAMDAAAKATGRGAGNIGIADW